MAVAPLGEDGLRLGEQVGGDERRTSMGQRCFNGTSFRTDAS
jgi:hypothetical protein